MPFDGLFLYGVCRELNDKLKQGRIEKIYQPEKDEIILVISRPGNKSRLLLNAGAENARVHLTDSARPNPIAPPVFCMLLRKHLEGARIKEFRQPGLDRVLEILVDSRDELGNIVQKSLICEIMGRYSNIVLVTRNGDIILDGIKRYTHAVSRHREVLPGRPYVPPPAQEKADLLSLNEDGFRELVLNSDLSLSLAEAMQKTLDGLSIPTCREIVRLAGLEKSIKVNHCGEHELRKIWQTLQPIVKNTGTGEPQATLVSDTEGKPVDLFAIPLIPKEGLQYSVAGMNRAADILYTFKMTECALNRKKQELLKRIKKETKRLDKKLEIQQQTVSDAEKGDRYRLYGELITANLYRIERGISEIELENYYDPSSPPINVQLAPNLSGSENAQAYFKKYNKTGKATVAARKFTKQTMAELNYLEGVATAIEMAENIEELEEISQELMNQGYIKKPVPMPGKKQPKVKKPFSRPLKYISQDGFNVLVGKNNRQNDQLTLKTAEDDDIWLHTCKIPGSHVIIRTGGVPVPDSTLLAAASLAAYYSRARDSSNVPVDYTRRKHVKKPGGAVPGYVIYEKQKTVYVNPQRNAMKLLEDREDNH